MRGDRDTRACSSEKVEVVSCLEVQQEGDKWPQSDQKLFYFISHVNKGNVSGSDFISASSWAPGQGLHQKAWCHDHSKSFSYSVPMITTRNGGT